MLFLDKKKKEDSYPGGTGETAVWRRGKAAAKEQKSGERYSEGQPGTEGPQVLPLDGETMMCVW